MENSKTKDIISKIPNIMRQHIVLIALVVVVTFFGIAADNFFTLQNFFNIGRQTAIISIIAFGMTYLIISANIDLSVGSVSALGGLVCAIVIQFTSSIILGVVAGLMLGATFGLLNGIISTKFRVPSFLTTLGTLGIARGIALLATGTKPVVIYKVNFWKAFGDGQIGGVFPIIILWTLIIFFVSYIILKYSGFGMQVYATGGNILAAKYFGIKTKRIIIIIFVITGILASFAGIVLASRMHTAWPNSGRGLELDVIAAVILGGTSLFGGKGTIQGTILGAIVIGTINNGLILMGGSTQIQTLVRSILIIAAVIFALDKKE